MEKRKLQDGILEIDGGLVVFRPDEGVDLSARTCQECTAIIERRVKEEWDLVIDMVNPASMTLQAILTLRDNPRINSLLMICYRKVTQVVARQSLDMIGKPGGIVSSIDEAREWVENNRSVGKIA